ncbi:MAG: 30S ribosomal protein S5, partial [Nitrosopumilus sp.]
MSQATQSKPGQGKPGQGKPGGGRPGGGRPTRPVRYGGGRPGAAKPGQTGRRQRREQVEEVWVPKTTLGQKVNSGEISSIEEILEAGLRIQEAGIIKKLLPDLKSEVVDVGIIQKMTSNGQSTRF